MNPKKELLWGLWVNPTCCVFCLILCPGKNVRQQQREHLKEPAEGSTIGALIIRVGL